MKANGVDVALGGNEPGFTLPTNIVELGDDITTLNLSNCSLTGTIVYPVLRATCFDLYLALFCRRIAQGAREVHQLASLQHIGQLNRRLVVCPSIHALCSMRADIFYCFAGELPKELGKLINLTHFNVAGNSIGGELYVSAYMRCNFC